jgi:hypothetical protein
VGLGHGCALKVADKEDEDQSSNAQVDEDYGWDLKAMRQEDAAVHEQPLNLDEHNCRHIGAVDDQQQLQRLYLPIPKEDSRHDTRVTMLGGWLHLLA